MSHFNGTEQPPRALLRAGTREERRELPRSFHSPPALLRAACHRFIFNRAPHTMAPGAAHFAALLSCLLLSFRLFYSFSSHLLLLLPSFFPLRPFPIEIRSSSSFSLCLSLSLSRQRWSFDFLALALWKGSMALPVPTLGRVPFYRLSDLPSCSRSEPTRTRVSSR